MLINTQSSTLILTWVTGSDGVDRLSLHRVNRISGKSREIQLNPAEMQAVAAELRHNKKKEMD